MTGSGCFLKGFDDSDSTEAVNDLVNQIGNLYPRGTY